MYKNGIITIFLLIGLLGVNTLSAKTSVTPQKIKIKKTSVLIVIVVTVKSCNCFLMKNQQISTWINYLIYILIMMKRRLMAASRVGRLHVVQALLKAGADPSIKNLVGKTAFDLGSNKKAKALLQLASAKAS